MSLVFGLTDSYILYLELVCWIHKDIVLLTATPLLSVHFLSMDIRAVYLMYDFLYPHKWVDKCLSIYFKIYLCVTLSYILDTTGKTFTGLSFFNKEISSFLDTGVTSASLRLVETLFCVIIFLFEMLFNGGV